MTTPARLSEIECPACHETTWITEPDYHEPSLDGGEIEPAYGERSYACPSCRRCGAGWSVRQQAPPTFLLQPHRLYPMRQEEFDHWVDVLREHFPDHPRLKELGTTFYPCSHEEAAAFRREMKRLLQGHETES